MTDFNARAKEYEERSLIPLMMGCDEETIKLFERLKALYGKPHIATAILNACENLNFLITAFLSMSILFSLT